MSDDFSEESNLEEWVIELERVKNDRKQLTVTRLLAASLMVNPYMTIGDFFQSISDEDLQTLVEKVDELDFSTDKAGDVLLITMMLAQAEGSPAQNFDELHNHLTAMCVFIAGTSLVRKGLATAYYKNMSFGADMDEAVVFERI